MEIENLNIAENSPEENEASSHRELMDELSKPAILVSGQFRIEYANERFRDLFGYQLEDLDQPEAFDSIFVDKRNAQSLKTIIDNLSEAASQNHAPCMGEVEILPKQGPSRTTRPKPVFIRNGTTAIIFRDTVNLAGPTPKAHLIQKAQLEILDHISDAALVVDQNQQILWSNKSLCAKLGKSRSEVDGSKCHQILHGSTAPPPECPIRVCMTSDSLQQREICIDRIGGPHSVTNLPLKDDTGRMVGTICVLKDQSEEKAFQRAKKDSEDRYRSLVDRNPDGIAIHHKGELIYVNQAGADLLGFQSTDQVVGRKLLEFIHPEDQGQIRMKQLMLNRNSYVPPLSDERLLRSDGKSVSVEMAIIPINYDGKRAFQIVFRDITKRKIAEKALKESEEEHRKLYKEAKRAEELYRSLLKSSADAIVIYDLEGRTQYVSDSFTETFGWTIEELRDQKIDYVPNEEYEYSMEMIHKLLADGEPCIGMQTKRFTKDGRLLDISMSASRHNDHEGNPAGILVILHDVTERNRAEKLLRNAERNRAMAEMAGGVAHNFNNLLQIVMSAAQSGLRNLERNNEDRVQECLRHVLSTSKHGAETVKRLQEFARVRERTNMDEGEIFNLSETTQQAIEMSKLWLQADPAREVSAIEICSSLDDRCFVLGRENEIFEVILNLLKNAAEATPRDGIIEVRTYCDEAECVIEVKDSGVGIPEDFIPKIFQPFWSTKGMQGTGMGLASSYGIVYRHQGEILVSSGLNKGSLFTVRLPLATTTTTDKEEPLKSIASSRLNLLIIDDVYDILTLVGEGLEDAGHNVFLAKSGLEGLDIFKNKQVDAVICDLGMEGLTGWDVGMEIIRINREKNRPKTPFILLTGWASQIDKIDKISKAGVDKIMEKPAALDKLIEAVDELTGNVRKV